MQLEDEGENAVIFHSGANSTFTEKHIRSILDGGQPGDILLLQCETNLVASMIENAKERGMIVVFNAAPYPPKTENWRDEYSSTWLFINKNEATTILANNLGQQFETGEEHLKKILELTGTKNLVVTRGGDGCEAFIKDIYYQMPAISVEKIIDTTGAGDVFLGFFLKAYFTGICNVAEPGNVPYSLRYASAAGALAITRKGALDSIPSQDEVISFL